MRISVCVGNYAAVPYCVPGLGISVFCAEELCYCIRENAFLLDMSLMNDELVGWIEKECGLRSLAKALYPLVHRKGSLSEFVVLLLNFVGFYDGEIVGGIEQVLKQGAGLSSIERKKSQIDYLVKKKKYAAAVREYDNLIERWQERDKGTEPLPAEGCLADIWHNKGVALTGMMMYDRAAECFLKAYDTEGRQEFYRDYLAAKRMELSESGYVSFIAGNTKEYDLTLALERDMERLTLEWECQPEYLRLYARREQRGGPDRQRYDDESENLTQALKNSYRSSVAD